MLFDLKPKEDIKSFFDREKEIKDLVDSIERYPITMVTGLRRIGKSSLVHTVINDKRYQNVCLGNECKNSPHFNGEMNCPFCFLY